MKSNPHVYPYIPFQDLSQKEVKKIDSSKRISTDELKKLMKSIDRLDSSYISEEGTTSEKILHILTHDEIRFGPKEFITDQWEARLAEIEFFVSKNKAINYTILGFPFKIPVPLKTNRKLPDFGELLSLHRLYRVGQLIQEVYAPGCKIVIYSEGAFASAVGVSEEDAESYHVFLEYLIEKFGYSEILEARRLSDMESTVENFPELYHEKVQELKNLYNNGDEGYLKKYEGTYDAVAKIVTTIDIDQNLLMDAYNPDLADSELSQEALAVRKDIQNRTHEAIFLYHAYLMTRDRIEFLEKQTPNSLRMSVSPKPNRYGVQPINSSCNKLAYHSVPVLDKKSKEISQEYLIDIKRDESQTYTGVEWEEDKDVVPFYYERG